MPITHCQSARSLLAKPPQRAWLEKNVLLTPSGRASALAFMVTWRADRRYKDAQPLPLVT